MTEQFEVLRQRNDQAIESTYKRVRERVKDPALMTDINVLMRLSRYKGIYDEVADQRIIHALMESEDEQIRT